MTQPGESGALIDRAKAIVNERIDKLGLDDTYSSYAPVYAGLPITHEEGQYLLECVERDLGKAIGRGVPWEKAMAGGLHWAFLVGVFAGKGVEDDA